MTSIVLLKSVHFKKTVAQSSFLSKKVVIFSEIKIKSADVILKMTTLLKEMRIAQLCSLNERTLIESLE